MNTNEKKPDVIMDKMQSEIDEAKAAADTDFNALTDVQQRLAFEYLCMKVCHIAKDMKALRRAVWMFERGRK